MSTENLTRAREHAELAERLLALVDHQKILDRGDARDPRDGHAGALAGAHAALALFYQRAAA